MASPCRETMDFAGRLPELSVQLVPDSIMAAFGKAQCIWRNGKLAAWDDGQTHSTAHGRHYGTGVFEGMRAYDTAAGPAIFRLDAHMHRMVASAAAYEMTMPYSVDALSEAS